MTTYALARVNMKENVESVENNSKDELEQDEKRKQSELLNLGFVAKFYLGLGLNDNVPKTNKNVIPGQKETTPNFNSELNSIDDKVKQECIKIYTGEFAKLINNPEKLPASILPFLQNLKSEMENFRLKCVRDLRTYVIDFNNHLFSAKNYMKYHLKFRIFYLNLYSNMQHIVILLPQINLILSSILYIQKLKRLKQT